MMVVVVMKVVVMMVMVEVVVMVMMDGGNDGGLAHGVEFGFCSIWALCHIFRFKTILTLEIQSYQEHFMKHKNCIQTITIAG